MARRSPLSRLFWLTLCLPACETSSVSDTPHVGDKLDHGTVVDVTSGGGCHVVTLEHAPAWACSAKQLADLEGGFPSYEPTVAAGPLPVASAPALRPTDCAGLAALRRPALKSMQRSSLQQARQQLLFKCLPTSETRYFNDRGEQLSGCPARTGGGFYADAGALSGSLPSGWASSPQNAAAPTGAEQSAGAQEYSTTNTQLADVDEADYVKTTPAMCTCCRRRACT